MRKFTLILLHLIAFLPLKAQVPSEMEFAGMELKLTDEVRRKLQADIDMITRSQKAFQTKVDRADLYFPIIEKIFKEEELPDDFKFLSLQESSLISDAVSTSNAVGYWQFKKETAIEVGMRVDNHVDERMNIVSSSRGAAKYLKKNNTIYFNNWIYALLAYNLGAGGAKPKIKEKYLGAKKMVIDGDMHWYVIRFLAHKLAYENSVGKNNNLPMTLVAYNNCRNKSLKEISKETEVEYENLEMYNKWLLRGNIPDDKEYYVILPVNSGEKERLLARTQPTGSTEEPAVKPRQGKDIYQLVLDRRNKKRKEENVLSGTGDVAMIVTINGVRTIKAKEGDTPSKLALQGGISTYDFLRYNDLKSFEQIEPGAYYYLQSKKSKGLELFHTVQYGETLRDISQKHAVRMDAIRSKNRMSPNENPQPGRVLWLRRKRPQNVPVEMKKVEKPEPVPAPPVVQPKEEIQTSVPQPEVISAVKENADSSSIQTETQKVLANPPALPESLSFHEVKQGETLYGISRMYSLPLDTLRAWNQLQGNDIKLGQKLIVQRGGKAANAADGKTFEHTVQAGETMYQISRKYGVSIENIQIWNNKKDASLSLGEKLIIKISPE